MKPKRWLLSVFIVVLMSMLGPAQCVGAPYVFRTIDVPGATNTRLNGINNHGHVVGTFVEDGTGYGFLFDGETFTKLTFPGAKNTMAKGINDDGQIVGSYGSVTFRIGEYGFLFDDGEYTTLDVPGGRIIEAEDINNHGQITGIFADAEGAHAFLLDGEELVRLTVPGANRTEGLGLNDAGVVAGCAYEGEPLYGHWTGFTHDGDGFDFIYSGKASTLVTGINDSGQLVGWTMEDPRLAVLDTFSSFVPGGGKFCFPGAAHTVALGLNDEGQVVGYYWAQEYGMHGFLATPVPEPSTWILLLSGLSCVVWLVLPRAIATRGVAVSAPPRVRRGPRGHLAGVWNLNPAFAGRTGSTACSDQWHTLLDAAAKQGHPRAKNSPAPFQGRTLLISVIGIVAVSAYQSESFGGQMRIVHSIPLPYGTVVGHDLAWDGRYLWTSVLSGIAPLSGGGVGFTTYALDPVDGAILSSLNLEEVPNAFGHAWDGSGLWNTSFLTDLQNTPPDMVPDYLSKHSPTGSLMTSWPAPHSPDAMPRGAAWDGTHLWISDSRHDEILRVDPTNGSLVTSFASPGTAPLGLAWDGASLWVVDGLDEVIYQLDTSGGIIESWSVPIENPDGLTFDGQYFWILDNYSSKVFAVAVPEPCALVLSLVSACSVFPFVGARLIRAAQTVRRGARCESSRFPNHA